MLFTESQIAVQNTALDEAAAILNEAVYLTEEEANLSPVAVPVVENSRLNAPVVHFADVERLAEENGIAYDEAMEVIAQANGLSEMAVAVPEWKMLMDPSIVNEMSNIVIAPLAENDIVGQFTEACLNSFVESGDTGYIDALLEVSLETKAKAAEKVKKIDELAKKYALSRFNKPFDQLSSLEKKEVTSLAKTDVGVKVGNQNGGSFRTVEKYKLLGKAGQNAIDKFKDKESEKVAEKYAKQAIADANGEKKTDNKDDGSTSPEEEKAGTFLEKVKKNCYHKPKTFIYKQIAKIREWAANMEKSTETGVWAKIKAIVAKVLKTLTAWANDDKVAAAGVGNQI